MSNSTSALSLHVLRNGLPRLGRKLRSGQPVTIAYLGGSITQAYESDCARHRISGVDLSAAEEQWRVAVFRWSVRMRPHGF